MTLYFAAALVAILGLAHSILGERYILIRLFRRDVPKLFGGMDFTRRTLRFAWHFTTVLAFGIAALLVQLAGGASAVMLTATIEPPRESWRLQLLREWSHEQVKEVFP